jgi:hypothetical protein
MSNCCRYFVSAGVGMFLVFHSVLQCSASEDRAKNKWRSYRKGASVPISGLAMIGGKPAGSTFLVAHDSKGKTDQKLAVLTVSPEQLGYEPIAWPATDESPTDIEAIRAVPGSDDDYLVLTSSGVARHITIDADKYTMKVKSRFRLPIPDIGANLEGLALHQVENDLLIAWGHRGRTQEPGVIYWGKIDLATQLVDQHGSLPFRVPWPKRDEVRHIADMVIDKNGILYVSSSSDPGKEGPFGSALYQAGAFSFRDGRALFEPDISRLYRTHRHKIEGIECVGNGFALATDDENKGSAFLLLP